MAVFVVTLLMASMVSAGSVGNYLTLSKVEVEIDGHDVSVYDQADFSTGSVDDLNALAVKEGDVLSIDVSLEANQTLKDVQIVAELTGYEYSDSENLDDRTSTFDMEVPVDAHGVPTGTTTESKTLEITLPKKLDKDRYLLRLRVDDKDSASLDKYVVLQIEPSRHGVDIKDVAFSPGTTVKAGRSLLANVLLENYGDRLEKDVKVTVSIPELGVSATQYVDELETDNHNIDYKDVEEMFLPIPADAAEGTYDVEVAVEYNDLRETVTKTYTVKVLGNEQFQTSDKLVLAVGPETQTVAAGKTATYGIALTNAGATSKAYTLSVVTGSWATATVSDSLVVLSPGQNKVVYVDVAAAADATVGEHVTSVAVKSGEDVLENVALKATVVPGVSVDNATSFSLRNGLEIALIVLVVLLVVIGLIVGFSRLRKDEEDEEQTYY